MIIPSDTSHEYFNIQPRRHKIPKANPVSPEDYANQLTEQHVLVFILFPPQGPEDHLQAQQYQPKIWNIHIDFLVSGYEAVIEIFVDGSLDNIQAYCVSVLISSPVW